MHRNVPSCTVYQYQEPDLAASLLERAWCPCDAVSAPCQCLKKKNTLCLSSFQPWCFMFYVLCFMWYVPFCFTVIVIMSLLKVSIQMYTCLPFYNDLLHSTLFYSTLLYSTILYSTQLYSTLLYSSLVYSTLLYSTLLYSTLLYFGVCNR